MVVAEPHRMYVASSHVGRCRCENGILVIRHKYFALISSTDLKCTLSHKTLYWLSQHLSKCIIELTHALERDSMEFFLMWTCNWWQRNSSNGESDIECFVWAISPIICVALWGMFRVKISVIFHDVNQFRRDMWLISSQDGCCTLIGCLFSALSSQERRYSSPPWRCINTRIPDKQNALTTASWSRGINKLWVPPSETVCRQTGLVNGLIWMFI